MTQKRFTWIKKDFYAPQIVITDSLTKKDLTPTDCYGLLNGLYEENKALKKQREELFIRERNTKNEWRELKEKNKFILGQIKAFRDDCYTYLDFDGASTLNRLLDILGEER